VMAERRREGIDTDKDEGELEIYDEGEHGQIDDAEQRRPRQ